MQLFSNSKVKQIETNQMKRNPADCDTTEQKAEGYNGLTYK